MPARSGFPSGVRGGVDPRLWADASSSDRMTVASNANPLTSERLRAIYPPRRRAPIGVHGSKACRLGARECCVTIPLVAESSVEINNELTALEADLKRLEAEYNMYFSGRLQRPPWETRARVDATVK